MLSATALHEIGDESLVGIVETMTGEKDPRNLMLVFSILKVLMIEWDISNHVEVLKLQFFSSYLPVLPTNFQSSFSIQYTTTFLSRFARHQMIRTVSVHRI